MRIINRIAGAVLAVLGLVLVSSLNANVADAQARGVTANLIRAVDQAAARGDAAALTKAAEAVIAAANGDVGALAVAIRQAVTAARGAQQPSVVNAFIQHAQGQVVVYAAVAVATASNPATLAVAAEGIIGATNGNPSALAATVKLAVATSQADQQPDVVNAFIQHAHGQTAVYAAVIAGVASNPDMLALAAQSVITATNGTVGALESTVREALADSDDPLRPGVVNAFIQNANGQNSVYAATAAGAATFPEALAAAARGTIAAMKGNTLALATVVNQAVGDAAAGQQPSVIQAFAQEANQAAGVTGTGAVSLVTPTTPPSFRGVNDPNNPGSQIGSTSSTTSSLLSSGNSPSISPTR